MSIDWRYYVCLVFGLWCFVFYVEGFNIDVKEAAVLNGSEGSYFGYAVSMLVAKEDKKWWVFVGAPRDNDALLRNIVRPGAIHKCSFQASVPPSCNKLHIDNSTGSSGQEWTDFNGGKKYYTQGRNASWLGGGFDIPTDHPNKGIVTCAHKWYNVINANVSTMNGLCYVIPPDLTLSNVKKLPAMINENKQTTLLPWNKTVDYYSSAGMGMVMHWTKKYAKLLLGTPGLLHWSGGFVEIDGDVAKYVKKDTDILNETVSHLYGSAITSGEYFGNGIVYYVIGAPRASLTGKVVLFNSNNVEFSLADTDVEIHNESLPVNAYFGSVLCTADVNNDGLDDLLVGAPVYSPREVNATAGTDDQGRVFLYLGLKRQFGKDLAFSPKVQEFRGRGIAGARFGSAISSLGDISRDNFEDIAIGAPYEDDNRGAVYIYNGYKGGLYHMYSQRISAEEIDPGLRGFGISLSKTADINSDGTPDVAVGSYLSDNAVVLYGQPVINFDTKRMYVLNEKYQKTGVIARNSSGGDRVQVCFEYTDPICTYIDLDVVINLDKGKTFPRIVSYDLRDSVIHMSKVRLFTADTVCRDEEIAVRSNSDLVSPIIIEAKYGIQTMSCEGIKVAPTINAFNGSDPGDTLLVMTTMIYFKKDCPDNKCLTDLHLSYSIKYPFDRSYFTNGMPYLVINITITKDGHPSYGSRFIIAFPKYLAFRKMEQVNGDTLVSCSPAQTEARQVAESKDASEMQQQEDIIVDLGDDKAGQVCSFGNPMHEDSGVGFLLTLGVPKEVTVSSMTLKLAVLTQSIETSPSDNNQTAVVELKHEVAARLSGQANPESIFTDKTWQSPYLVKHTYELENNGPSILSSAEMHVHFPQYQRGGHAQLYLNKIEVNCPCELNCSATNSGKSPAYEEVQNGRLISNTSISDTDNMRFDAINHLDCTDDDCAVYHCSIEKLQAGKGVVLSLQFALQNELQQLTKGGKSQAFRSSAQVQLDKQVMMTTDKELMEKLSTSLIPPKPKKGVDWWIIVASIIGGIALIVLMVFVLYKVGFFKRKKWEEYKKEESDEEEKLKEKETNGKDLDKVSFTDSEDGVLEKEQEPTNETSF